MTWVSKTLPAMVAAAAAAAVAVRDLWQRDHALQRNFPLLGHARYALESTGPELRDWLLIHMGFAMEVIDAAGAERALEGLELMGRPRPADEGVRVPGA